MTSPAASGIDTGSKATATFVFEVAVPLAKIRLNRANTPQVAFHGREWIVVETIIRG